MRDGFDFAHPEGAALLSHFASSSSREMTSHSDGPTSMKCAFWRCSRRGHALAGSGAHDDRPWVCPRRPRAQCKPPTTCDHVVAVDLDGVPAERAPLVGDRFDVDDHRAIGLDAVAVDHRDEVVEAEGRSGGGGFPGRALLQFAVGDRAEDAAGPTRDAITERRAHRDAESVSERAAGHLDARKIAFDRRHLERTSVGAVGRKPVLREVAGFRQHRPQRDRVVARSTGNTGRVLPNADSPGRGAVHGNRARRGNRRRRSPGRDSPGPFRPPAPACCAEVERLALQVRDGERIPAMRDDGHRFAFLGRPVDERRAPASCPVPPAGGRRRNRRIRPRTAIGTRASRRR